MFGQLIHTAVGLLIFSFALEYVKMMKTSFLWGMLCCAQHCFFIEPPGICFFNYISIETFIIDKNFKIIKLWGMDIACMDKSLVFYR